MEQLRRWVIGWILAAILMWSGSWFFLDSVPVYVNDPACGCRVLAEGHAQRFRGEGGAVTRFGKHGIACIPDVSLVEGPKVAIWGDSFVAAYQVTCRAKIARQVTAISGRSAAPVTGVALAEPNRSAADYYHLLPAYDRLVRPALHVLCLASISDVCPGSRGFVSEPEYALLTHTRSPSHTSLRRFVNRAHLEFLWALIRKCLFEGSTGETRRLRFRPGPSRVPEVGDAEPSLSPAEAWDFLVSSLRSQTERPLLFLYAPVLPTIRRQRIIFEDHTAAAVEGFRLACKRNDVGFLDISERFRDFHRSTGKFPSGFHNGFPSRGHWNAEGHRLAAEAIVEYIEEHSDAVFAD